MQTYTAKDFADARRIVRHYRLEMFRWAGSGTVNGFTNFLFVQGKVVSVTELAEEISSYKAHFRMNAAEGRDFDVELAQDAHRLSTALARTAEKWARLAAVVGDVKYGPDGGALWSAIALMATCPRCYGELDEMDGAGLMPRVDETLSRLRDLADDFPECVELGYVSGLDEELDYLVRLDIERLDETLQTAAASPGSTSRVFSEIGALLSLASDVRVLSAIRMALDEDIYQRSGARRVA